MTQSSGDTETKFVFVRFDADQLTVEWGDAMSTYEAWAFLMEATDVVRAVLDGNNADDDADDPG